MPMPEPEKLRKSPIESVQNQIRQSSSLGVLSTSEHIHREFNYKNLNLTMVIKPRDTHVFKIESRPTSVGIQRY